MLRCFGKYLFLAGHIYILHINENSFEVKHMRLPGLIFSPIFPRDRWMDGYIMIMHFEDVATTDIAE